ncbi:hypothetical protein OZ382_001920 [Vibrio cholerae]|nr:hypothetical protein [Vibrio cholerae]
MRFLNWNSVFLMGVISFILYSAYFYHGGTYFRMVPVHHDDYSNLSSFINDFFNKGVYVRPVSTMIIAFLSMLGELEYLIFQFLFLSTYVFLVIIFLSRIFNIRVTWYSVACSAVFISTLPNVVEYHFYTGLMTNLSSAVFGMLALVLFQRFNGEKYLKFVILFLILSAFSKEDYILPFIVFTSIFCVYDRFLVQNNDRLVLYLKLLFISLLILVSSLIFNKSSGSAFVSSDTSYYLISFDFFDILNVYNFYLFRNIHFVVLVFISILLSLIHITSSFNKKEAFLNILIIYAIVLSLIAPYSLLKNHLAPYYSFMWFVWISVLSCVIIQSLCAKIKISYISAFLYSFSVLFMAFYFSFHFKPERESVIRWYENQQNITLRIFNALDQLLLTKSNLDKIYVINPPGLSPWSHSSGQYLERKMHINSQWVVLVKETDNFYTVGEHVGKVSVLKLNDINKMELGHPSIEFTNENIIIDTGAKL